MEKAYPRSPLSFLILRRNLIIKIGQLCHFSKSIHLRNVMINLDNALKLEGYADQFFKFKPQAKKIIEVSGVKTKFIKNILKSDFYK